MLMRSLAFCQPSSSGHLRSIFQTAWDIGKDALINFRDNGQTNQAAAISLYAILSLIPFVILTFVVAGYIFGAHPEVKIRLLQGLQYLNITGASDIIAYIGILEEKQKVFGGLGIITLIWFSSMVFGAIETAFNMIFRAPRPRSYIASKALAISMVPLAWLLGTASFIASSLASFLPQISDVPFYHFLRSGLFRFGLPFVVTAIFCTLLYKIIPHIRLPWKISLWAGVTFALLLEPTKHIFPWYVTHYAKYNLIYGSLGTIIIFIFWVFYGALIFLFCAEVMASYLRRDVILLEKMFSRSRVPSPLIDERVVKKFGQVFPRDTYVFKEGEEGKEMYYVITGRVQMEKKSGPVKKILGEMGPGQYFGEMAALIEAPRTASAYTLEDSTLAVINRTTFAELLKKSEGVSLLMLQEFSRRLKLTSEVLEQTSKNMITLYIILYLLHVPKESKLPQLTEEIANHLGREKQEVEAIIQELSLRGIIMGEEEPLRSLDHEAIHSFMRTLHRP